MKRVFWTIHAEERQKEWENKIGITKEEVERVLENPDQVVPGDMSILIAQGKLRGGLLRIPFLETGGNRKIITVYWTSKIDKYWKEAK